MSTVSPLNREAHASVMTRVTPLGDLGHTNSSLHIFQQVLRSFVERFLGSYEA